MDAAAIITAIGALMGGLAGVSALVVALGERKKKSADYAEQMVKTATEITQNLVDPLRIEVKRQAEQIKDQAEMIASLRAALLQKDAELIERDRVIIHLQGQILTLETKIKILESQRQTAKLTRPK